MYHVSPKNLSSKYCPRKKKLKIAVIQNIVHKWYNIFSRNHQNLAITQCLQALVDKQISTSIKWTLLVSEEKPLPVAHQEWVWEAEEAKLT